MAACDDREFTSDYAECAICGEPAAWRVWFGDDLLAVYCERHHNEWWLSRDELWAAALEAEAALTEARPRPLGAVRDGSGREA